MEVKEKGKKVYVLEKEEIEKLSLKDDEIV